MRAMGTILLDSLRLLRARKIFWVALWITVLLALVYMSIGFNDKGITYLFGLGRWENDYIRAGSELAEPFYLLIFSLIIVNYWLSWVAVVLAMIACAPIFPEFIEGGNSGVVLSKPVSRLGLFFYKYLGGLLFVAVQTLVFCALVFIALRWRTGAWNPSVFWAVPLLVLLFSYLWSVMIAVGVKTRSVLASLLAALLVWFGCWAAKAVEEFSWTASEYGEVPGAFGQSMRLSEKEQAVWKERYPAASIAYKILPKTSDTTGLLIRKIRLGEGGKISISGIFQQFTGAKMSRREAEMADESLERHPITWLIGTSLAFEVVMLAAGAWMFCRRDF